MTGFGERGGISIILKNYLSEIVKVYLPNEKLPLQLER